MNDRSVYINAFQPASELEDPERFAGRSTQVRQLSDALRVDGSVPVIFGDRGLGKSSLALQIRRIAMGDADLLSAIGAERLVLPEQDQFLTFYVTCTDATQSLTDLLQLMINSAESVDLAPGGNDVARQLMDRSTRRKLTLKVFEYESTKRFQVESKRLSYQDLGLEEKLVQVADLLTATYGHRVLFIVDELDRMDDTTGLASFLKAASSPTLKFLLVGIASNIANLLHDHRSLERRLMTNRLPPMTEPELGQIVVKAQAYMRENEIDVQFEDSAILRLASVATGYPWFTHVFGQQALIDAEERGETTITRRTVDTAIGSIAANRFAQQFSDLYQMAVRDSWRREATLRMFALWGQTDVPTGEMYSRLRGLGITNGGTYRSHLLSTEHGAILIVPAFQQRGLVRFRDEMFKAYVRLRPSIYKDLDSRVREAYRSTE